MTRKVILTIIIAGITLLLVSCWDQIEIEDQAFIVGIALDKSDESGKLEVTFQIAHPKAFMAESQVDEPFWNITQVSEDITTARNELIKKINWIPTFEHCQILLISEDVAKDRFEKYLDFLIRTFEVRKKLQIAIVQGKAKEILDLKFKSGIIPSFVISEILNKNTKYSFEVTDYSHIGRIHIALIEGHDFILCRIIPLKDELSISGGAVIKDFMLAGWLSGEEVMGARFLRGDVESGFLEVKLPPELGEDVILRIYESESELKPEIRGDKLYAVLNIRLEGDINEITAPSSGLNSDEYIKKASVVIEKNLENIIKRTFKKVQQEFASDPFRIKEKTQSYYPHFYQANQGHWDEIYRSAELEISTEIMIRRIGEIKNRKD